MKSLLPVFLGSLLVACNDTPRHQGPLCRTASGLGGANGISMQGVDLQGVDLQGVQIQGVQIQGVQIQGVQIQGVQLQGASLNGATLAGIELVGTTLMSGKQPLDVIGARITALSSDGKQIPLTFTAIEPIDDLTYYSLAMPDGTNVCGEAGKGLFVAGVWDETGRRADSLASGDSFVDTTFSCTRGVIAKCVRWGYEPWVVGPELHQTCTRMARADYCGDGVSHTVDGTRIDLYDAEGIQVPEAIDMEFEAGWGPNGAVCVHRPRYLDQIPSCWSTKPTCGSFDEAIDQGALMGNASGRAQHLLCAE